VHARPAVAGTTRFLHPQGEASTAPKPVGWKEKRHGKHQIRQGPHGLGADSDVKPAGIPINIRPPFRFEAGHDSNQLPAGFRH
jgi:hypothetical protein